MKRLVTGFFVACCTLFSVGAQGQDFALNRYEPSQPGSNWLYNESLEINAHQRGALGLVFDWTHKPLVLYAPGGEEELDVLVRHQLYAHLGANWQLWERLLLGVNVPLLLLNDGNDVEVDGTRFPHNPGVVVGDLRFSADVRVLGAYGTPFVAALGVGLYVPTDVEDAFASDGELRLKPRALVAGRIGQFEYATHAGVNYRPRDEPIANAEIGSEFTFGAAAGVWLLDDQLLLGPELYGASVFDAFLDRATTPLEAILSSKFSANDELKIGLGAGTGLTRGLGTPAPRVLLSLDWQPREEPPRDSDGDGILDAVDACVTVPGEHSSDVKKHGCPVEKDRDDDGILDAADACPTQAGVASENPKLHGCPDADGDGILDAQDACPQTAGEPNDDPAQNGCPPPVDSDSDGVFDPQDACPNEAGLKRADPAQNGCPDRDSDGDSVLDPVDACPKVKGVSDADPKKNGCPKAKIEENKITILERVEFETGKAVLRPESNGVLQSVLQLLQDNPRIRLVRIEGHTDNRGGAWLNNKLSRERAKSVMEWLVERGIDQSRLTSQGYGSKKPIDSNDTDVGRQNNRRVEFEIVKTDKE